MTASLEILTDRQNGVLSVPIQAVTTRADTSDKPAYARKKLDDADEEGDELFEIVFVNKDGKAELRVVKTGIQNDEDIVILSGLEEGEEIVTGPYSAISRTLKPGTVISEEKSESNKEE